MVAPILEYTQTVMNALLYNEQKVVRGVASVVMSSGVNGNDLDKVLDVFQRYESNPAIDDRTRNLGFHMSVCPGPTDGMDEVSILAFICEHMKNLGYGDQPYVVYRHNDIEREHYHVVSVRVDEKGKAINDSYSHYNAMESLRSLAPKYGFHIGADPARKTLSERSVEPAFLDMNRDGVMDQIDANFRETLEYEFNDFTEFAAAMRSWGIEASVVEREAGERKKRMLRFKALDEKGRSRSRYLFVDGRSKYHFEAEERLEKTLAENLRKPRTESKLIWLREAVRYCHERSTSLDDFYVKLSSCGITPYSLSKTEKGVHKARKLTNLVLVDHRNRISLSLPRIGGVVGMAELQGMQKKGETEPLSEQQVREVRAAAEAQVLAIARQKVSETEGKAVTHAPHL